MTAGGTMGMKWHAQNEAELKHHRSWKPIHRDHCSCPEEVCCQLTCTAWTTVASRPSRSGSQTIFHLPIEHQPAGDESSRVGFTSAEHLAQHYAGQRLQAGSVTQWQLLVAHWAKRQGPWRGQMDNTRARLHSSSVSSDHNQPPAACPRRKIWALLSNIGMTVGTVAPQALVIIIARAYSQWRWIALVPSFAAIPQLASCDIR